MSLLIKGMEMPKHNGEHKEFDRYGCYLTVYKDGKVKLHICDTDYDVVEVPTPHGRLIDADRLIAALKSTTAISQSDYDLFYHIVRLIEHQPTVAEKEMNNESK